MFAYKKQRRKKKPTQYVHHSGKYQRFDSVNLNLLCLDACLL